MLKKNILLPILFSLISFNSFCQLYTESFEPANAYSLSGAVNAADNPFPDLGGVKYLGFGCWHSGTGSNTSINTSTGHTGSNSVQSSANSDGDNLISPRFELTSGIDYTISFWYKRENTETASFSIDIDLPDGTADNYTPLLADINITETPGTWTQATIVYNAPSGGTAKIRFIFHNNFAGQIIYLDDFSINPVTFADEPCEPGSTPLVIFNPVADTQIDENDNSTIEATIQRVGFVNTDSEVQIVLSGTATSGTDYTAASTFPLNQTFTSAQNSFTIPLFSVIQDALDETTENIIFQINSTTNSLTDSRNTLSFDILDDDNSPVAVADNYNVLEDNTLNIAAKGVLDNDTDADMDVLNAVVVDDVSNGNLTLNLDGSFVYTPDLNYSGNDSFTYKASDGTNESALTTVTITVQSVNDLPTGANITVSTNEDIDKVFAQTDFVPSPFVDVDGTFGGIQIISVETAGDLEYNGVDVLANDLCSDISLLVFKPALNANGSPYATFTFKMRDNEGGLSTATYTMTINVLPVNDLPTGTDEAVSTNEDVNKTFAQTDFPSFVDIDGTFGGIQIISLETAGDLEYNGVDVLANDLCPDISLLVFKPALNANGSPYATFTFKIRDNEGGLSTATYTMTINVLPVNDLPTGTDEAVSTNEDVNKTFAQTGFPSFVDIDGTFGGIQIISLETAGDLEYNGVDVLANDLCPDISLLVFKPALNANGSPYATFTFKIRDNEGGLSTATYTMTINVLPVNDLPTGANITVNTLEDVNKTFAQTDFVPPFADVDGTFAGIQIIALETSGDLEYNGVDVAVNTVCPNVALLVFKPTANTNGTPSFTFKMRDNLGGLSVDTYTMTINVIAVNDAPIISSLPATLNVNQNAGLQTVNFNVSPGPNETQDLTITVTSDNPSLITNLGINYVQGSANASLLFEPVPSLNGVVNITVRVQDNGGTANGGLDVKTQVVQVTIIQVLPPAPTNLTSTLITSNQIDMAWQDNAVNEDGYRVERSIGGSTNFVVIATLGANATTFSNTGLIYNTIYCYRVVAFNATGTSLSNEICPKTNQILPNLPPSIISAIPISANQVDINWDDKSDNEDGFIIQRSLGNNLNYVDLTTVAANTEFYSDISATSNTRYCYRIIAFNIIGNSPPTADFCIITSDTPPPQPMGLTLTVVSATQINLIWEDNSENEAGFRIERSVGGNSNFTSIATVSANTESYANINLTPNTLYYYRIIANNFKGDSPPSNEAFATTPDVPPVSPTNFTVTPISARQINLTWTDNAANETGYILERSQDGNANYTVIANLNTNTTAYSDNNLLTDTEYCYRLKAFNAIGNSGSVETCKRTLLEIPATPKNLTATTISSSQISLNWSDESDNEMGFKIERSLNGNTNFVEVASLAANVETYMDGSLNYNTTYCYRVKAFNNGGNAASNEACAKTNQAPPVTPDVLLAKGISINQIELTWNDKSDNEMGFKIVRSLGDTDNFFEIATISSNNSTYIDNNLTPNQIYCYKIRAFNEIDTPATPYSNKACAAPIYNDILLPNTFTPNGDGKNDKFILRSRNIVAVDFTIYDRYGNIVFRTLDVAEATGEGRGWDGGNHPDGLYVWALKVKYVNGEEGQSKGKINLLRKEIERL